MKKILCFASFLLSIVLLSSCVSANPDQKTPPDRIAPQMETVQAPAPPEVEAKLETEAEAEPEPEPEITYILNKNTKKFHKSSCRSAKQISPKTTENPMTQGIRSWLGDTPLAETASPEFYFSLKNLPGPLDFPLRMGYTVREAGNPLPGQKTSA